MLNIFVLLVNAHHRDIRQHHREDIFENSVLVLSKCDKVRDGLEGDIMEKIDLSSAQLKQFPYRYNSGIYSAFRCAFS